MNDEQGETWFCAKDVCDALEHTNSRRAIAKLVDEGDVTKRYTMDALDRMQPTTFINESSLYSLILSCWMKVHLGYRSGRLPKTGSHLFLEGAEVHDVNIYTKSVAKSVVSWGEMSIFAYLKNLNSHKMLKNQRRAKSAPRSTKTNTFTPRISTFSTQIRSFLR